MYKNKLVKLVLLTSILLVGCAKTGGLLENVESMDASEETVEHVKLVFKKQSKEIYLMYQRVVRLDPKIEGEVVFQFILTSNGKVLNCTATQNTTGSEQLVLDACKRIDLFHFKKGVSRGYEKVSYPMSFYLVN